MGDICSTMKRAVLSVSPKLNHGLVGARCSASMTAQTCTVRPTKPAMHTRSWAARPRFNSDCSWWHTMTRVSHLWPLGCRLAGQRFVSQPRRRSEQSVPASPPPIHPQHLFRTGTRTPAAAHVPGRRVLQGRGIQRPPPALQIAPGPDGDKTIRPALSLG